MSAKHEITQLLVEAQNGDRDAVNELYDAVYGELRLIARQRLSRGRSGGTLNTTALVHEAYLRLLDGGQAGVKDRTHFFAVASRAMRFILIDYARRRVAQKRGGPQEDIPIDTLQVGVEDKSLDLLTLNTALEDLGKHSERLERVVEYRFFGGMTYDEIAELTGFSVPTVKRDWRRARTWLYRAMQEQEHEE